MWETECVLLLAAAASLLAVALVIALIWRHLARVNARLAKVLSNQEFIVYTLRGLARQDDREEQDLPVVITALRQSSTSGPADTWEATPGSAKNLAQQRSGGNHFPPATAMHILCPRCAARLTVSNPGKLNGRKGRCPKCGGGVTLSPDARVCAAAS